jgi:FKBP-type peptidyl-prolyl cis-trans isomerase 2
MQRVKPGDQVIIEYEGKLGDGNVVDSSADSGPFEFEVGAGNVFPGFDKGVVGMAVGETKTLTLGPEETYGSPDKELLHTVRKNLFKDNIDPKPGMVLGMSIERNGQLHKIPALVTEVMGDDVLLDFNHPLAGKTLIYNLTLKAIK